MYRHIFTSVLALIYLGQFTDAKPSVVPGVMHQSCIGKNFCTKPPGDYPTEIIEYLLMGVEKLWQEVYNDTTLIKRWSDGSVNNDECASASYNDKIYQIVDVDDQVRYVVQNEERFNQIIKTEVCLSPGPIKRPTSRLYTEITNYKFECQQSYMDFKFVVLSLDRTKLEAVKIKKGVPVCCACVLVK